MLFRSSIVSENIENWIGSKSISGYDLAKNLEDHLRAQEGIEFIDDDLVISVNKIENGFSVTTKEGKIFQTRYIILASGSSRKKLNIPGDEKFEGKGVVYCSTCDAPLFKNKIVAVVGGGNSALESVMDLVNYASKVYLLIRSEILKGDPITQDAVKTHPNVQIIFNAIPQEILGNDFVTSVKYKDAKTNEIKELSIDGLFVEIGLTPNSSIVKGIVDLNEYGAVITNEKTQETSMPGIWAAGDVTDGLYKQNNISVGDGIKAVLNVYDRLKSGK